MTDSKKAPFAAMVEAQACESQCVFEECERPTHEDYVICKECLRWASGVRDCGAEERRAEERFFGGADHARGYWDDYEPYEIY